MVASVIVNPEHSLAIYFYFAYIQISSCEVAPLNNSVRKSSFTFAPRSHG